MLIMRHWCPEPLRVVCALVGVAIPQARTDVICSWVLHVFALGWCPQVVVAAVVVVVVGSTGRSSSSRSSSSSSSSSRSSSSSSSSSSSCSGSRRMCRLLRPCLSPNISLLAPRASLNWRVFSRAARCCFRDPLRFPVIPSDSE